MSDTPSTPRPDDPTQRFEPGGEPDPTAPAGQPGAPGTPYPPSAPPADATQQMYYSAGPGATPTTPSYTTPPAPDYPSSGPPAAPAHDPWGAPAPPATPQPPAWTPEAQYPASGAPSAYQQHQQQGQYQPQQQQPAYPPAVYDRQAAQYQQPGYVQPGYQQPGYQQPGYQQQPQFDAQGRPLSDKSKMVAGLLGIFLGGFGAGRFYTGHTGIAVAQLIVSLCTLYVGAIWGLVDGIVILINGGTDAQGRILRD